MQKLVEFIQNIYATKEFIPLHEPRFVGNEKKYLNECIDSTFVSSVGEFVDRFEREFASYVGSKYAIACVNGTSALHASLVACGVGEGDEVITQALSFVATSNAISYTGAKTIFLDVDLDTYSLSAKALGDFFESHCKIRDGKCINKTTSKVIKACVPMHTFGHPCEIDEIVRICLCWHVEVIEDSAESLGSFYEGKHTGSFGKCGVFSFNGNKVITSGGGGVIVTDDKNLAKKLKHITTTAKVAHKWEFVHDMVAYNYRMPNLNAALLVAQLESLDRFLENKRELACEYEKFFEEYSEIEFLKEPKKAKSNYWLNAVMLKDEDEKEKFLEYMNSKGVMCRPIWRLLSELDMFRDCQRDNLKNSKYLAQRVVNIPSSVRAK